MSRAPTASWHASVTEAKHQTYMIVDATPLLCSGVKRKGRLQAGREAGVRQAGGSRPLQLHVGLKSLSFTTLLTVV